MLDGIVFRRQAKGIPADGVEHVAAFHPPLSGNDVDGGIAARMADMQSRAGRIGKLDQTEKFRFAVIILCGKGLLVFPDLLHFFSIISGW